MTVIKSYITRAILYGRDEWCLKESEMGILRRTERSIVKAMCGLQLKDRKTSEDLMLMLGLKDIIDELAMANSVQWYCVLASSDCCGVEVNLVTLTCWRYYQIINIGVSLSGKTVHHVSKCCFTSVSLCASIIATDNLHDCL